MPSGAQSRPRGYLDRELRRNDTVMKSGERANNADGFVTDATGIVDGSYRALTQRFISCPHPELKQILPARRAIGYSYGTLTAESFCHVAACHANVRD